MDGEDSEELNLGSDYNLIWCKVRTGILAEGTSDPRLKWKVDGKIEWKEYQQLVIEGFRGWEEHMEVYGWEGTKKVYNKSRNSGDIWAAEIGIGKKKLTAVSNV